jgi:POT family proton-dependent oligopeptide transporter
MGTPDSNENVTAPAGIGETPTGKHGLRPPAIDADVTTPRSHPPAIWFFFWGEFAERSSYYGMRAILFLYMTQALKMADIDASPLYAGFKMACYFLPLVGGIIADRWLGRYWTIVGFSVPYVAGHFILGLPNMTAMVIALALLAGGSGVIKPNISTLMGQTYDQKRPGQEQLRTAAFNWFYLSINVGALISMFCLPMIRNHYILASLPAEVRAEAEAAALKGEDVARFATPEGLQSAYAIAFAFPAWLMVLSLIVFAAGKPFYAQEKREHHVLTPEERRLQWQTLFGLASIFALVVLFWFGYEHNDTLWVAFIRDYVDLKVPFLSQPLSADQLQFLNALFVIILIPVFNVTFAYFDPKMRVFTRMRKVLAGFVLTAAAISIMAVAGYLVQGHVGQETQGGKVVDVATRKVSVWWPAMAYIVLTFGEVLLYGTMLELAYAAAPKSMKGFITACFLVTNTLGNFLNMLWTPHYGGSLKDAIEKRGSLPPGTFFGITALIVLFAAVVFVFVGKRFERSQAEAAAAGVT